MAQKNDLRGGADALKIFESNFISSINCRLTQVTATGTDVPLLRHINYRLDLQNGNTFINDQELQAVTRCRYRG